MTAKKADGCVGRARRAITRRRLAPRHGFAVVVVAALLALVLVSASGSGSGGPLAGASAGGAVGSRIVPFRLTSLAGRSIAVPSAGRPGVLFFSQSTCASCLPAAKALSAVKTRLGARLDALMVDVDARDRPADLRAWASVVGHPSYPLTIDTTGRLAAAYEIQDLGTTIIYNARGQIVERMPDPSIGDIEQGLHKAGLQL